MKALVITNCATAAYTTGLQAIFPDWEVKGANLDVAQKWLGDEPNTAFRQFLCDANLLVLGTENESAFEAFASGKDVLSIPYFYLRGFHPDSFHLGVADKSVPSVLRTGNLHSRIAAACSVLGLTQRETVAAFNSTTYEAVGYFSAFQSEERNLLARFAAKGIELAQAYERWRSSGNFLYTYNHPKAFVFNDILLEALAGRFIDEAQRRSAHAALGAVPDYLKPSIRWPVYPEIAARHGIETDFLWRTGVSAGPVSFTLDEFVAQTFETLAHRPELTADCIPGFEYCRAALVE
jgi:hypothetical protein